MATRAISVFSLISQEGQLVQFNVPLLFSRTDALSIIRTRSCQSYFLSDPAVTRLWYRPEPTVTWRPLRELSLTLEQEQVRSVVSGG